MARAFFHFSYFIWPCLFALCAPLVSLSVGVRVAHEGLVITSDLTHMVLRLFLAVPLPAIPPTQAERHLWLNESDPRQLQTCYFFPSPVNVSIHVSSWRGRRNQPGRWGRAASLCIRAAPWLIAAMGGQLTRVGPRGSWGRWAQMISWRLCWSSQRWSRVAPSDDCWSSDSRLAR